MADACGVCVIGGKVAVFGAANFNDEGQICVAIQELVPRNESIEVLDEVCAHSGQLKPFI